MRCSCDWRLRRSAAILHRGAAPLVREGLGIALADGIVAWHGFEGPVARPFEPQIAMQMVAATNDARPASRFVRPFLATLRVVL